MRGFAWAAALSILISSAAFAGPQVTVPQGALAGTTDGGISVFKDIPFAAPPIGDLRWRAPQPAANWSGVRDASKFGPICMQAPRPKGMAYEKLPESEDCLSLNVWSPNTAPGTGPGSSLRTAAKALRWAKTSNVACSTGVSAAPAVARCAGSR